MSARIRSRDEADRRGRGGPGFPALAGGALALDGRLVHLCAFALPGAAEETVGTGPETGTRLVRASRRGWGRLA
jgi:hypothetical protein